MSNKFDLDLELVRAKVKDSKQKIKVIADYMGIEADTLSSYLSGKRGLGKSAKLLLCDFLGIDRKSVNKKAS